MVWKALSLLALILFLALSSYRLSLPGVNYDEVLDAVPAMQAVQGVAVDAAATVRVAGREWPLMVMPYISATSSYWFMPFFALLGPTALALRLATIILSLITLLLLGGFLRDFFDERVAALTLIALAVNPTYLFWSRMGAYVAWPVLPLFIVTLWALYRWYRTGSHRALWVAAFALGFGLSTKILFLWVWLALALAWLLLSPWLSDERGWRRWLWPLRLATPSALLVAALSALLGSSMMLLYNVTTRGQTLTMVQENSRSTQLYGVNNFDLLTNLRIVFLGDFRLLLDGGWFKDVIGGTLFNPLAVGAFLLATLLLFVAAQRWVLSYNRRKVALLFILLGAIVAQSAITVTNFGANHLLLVLPIPAIVLSVALLTLHDRGRWGAAPLLLAVLFLAADGLTTLRYHQTLATTGGVDYWSDAIYALASDLEQADVTQPVAMDWGFTRNLQFVSQGRITAEDRFAYTNNPDAATGEAINVRIQQEPTLYLFHTPEQTAFDGHWQLFEEAAYRHRLTPMLWKSYHDRTGEPLYQVYEVVTMEPRYEAPAIEMLTDIRLANDIHLLGYDGPGDVTRASDALRLTLYWQSDTVLPRSYKVFAHLLDAQGQAVAQVDWIPMLWGYPTTQWQPREIVADRLVLPLSAPLASGTYRLYVGMYDEESGQRLPITKDGLPQPGDTVEMLSLTVP